VSDDEFKARIAASLAKKKASTKIDDKPVVSKPQQSDLQGESTPQPPETTTSASNIITLPSERSRRRSRRDQRTIDTQRDMPHSVEAELGVLSSIMYDGQFQHAFNVIAEVATKITPDYFYVPAHKTIYESFLRLWRSGTPIELISFTEYLRDHKVLDAIGGAPFVTQLINYVPTSVNVEWYIERMTDMMRRREAISAGTRLVRSAYASTDEEEFLDNVQRAANRVMTLSSVNGKFPQMCDVAEFSAENAIELPPLVIWYLLHQGSKMLIGGNSKGRKTWALLHLALSVSCGVDWWGFHTRRGCVCYVNLELQPAFFRQRLEKIIEVCGCKPEHGAFFAWHLRGYAKPMNELINDLLVFLQQHRFTLIIIDPIYKTLPATHGAENDSAIITQLLNDIEAIAVKTGAAVLFSSHFSKGDQSEKESIDRVSGSGAWARDPDSVLTMTAHEETDCFTVEATLRNLAPIKSFVVKWDFPLFVRQDEADPDKLKRPKGKGRPVEHAPEEILALMKDKTWRTAALQKHCDREEGIKSASFYRIWAQLRKDEKVIEENEGEWRRATESRDPY
jgi:RecA-family ATPase